jgi:hypothetical protein
MILGWMAAMIRTAAFPPFRAAGGTEGLCGFRVAPHFVQKAMSGSGLRGTAAGCAELPSGFERLSAVLANRAAGRWLGRAGIRAPVTSRCAPIPATARADSDESIPFRGVQPQFIDSADNGALNYLGNLRNMGISARLPCGSPTTKVKPMLILKRLSG